jgi:aspartate racemase
MKTIGLIGGLTWYSTLDYYKLLNELVNERKGGAHAAKLILYSVDFAEIKSLTVKEDWDGIVKIIGAAARSLEKAGAECLMIGANTMHNIADNIEAMIQIPLIHIADAVAAEIQKQHLTTIALLGTKYTMQMDFYKNRLLKHGIKTIIPSVADIEFINNSIYNEFSKGLFLPETKERYLRIIHSLTTEGAQGVIFGCTEIPILLKQNDCPVPVFDSALVHSKAAVDFSLK